MTRRASVSLVVVLLAALSLGGCLGKSAAPPEAPSQDAEQRRVENGESPPSWRVGDAWTYRFRGAGFGGNVTMAVTASGTEGLALGLSNQDFAFVSARYNLPFHQNWSADLSAVSGSPAGPVKLFDWPLTVGKTWMTTWLGRDVEAIVESTVNDTVNRYQLALMSDGQTVARYEYAPLYGNLVHFEADVSDVFDSAPRTVALDFDGRGIPNGTSFWRVALDGSKAISDLPMANAGEHFSVAENPARFWMPFFMEGAGMIAWRIQKNGADVGAPATAICPCDSIDSFLLATTGDWTWDVDARGAGTIKIGIYLAESFPVVIDAD